MPRKTALRGLPAAPPMPSTSCFSHRKLSADTAVPINHPAPHHQPRQASSATAPPAPIAQISFQMRATARSIHSASRGAAVDFPDVLLCAARYQVTVAPPFVPGSEFAGDVTEVADGVVGVAVGDRVA